MAQNDHRLEQRSALLATRVQERIKAVTDALSPPGQRRPFTVEQSRNDALAWWSENFGTPTGKKVMANWSPEDIGQLQVDLAQWQAERQGYGGFG